MPSAAAKSLTGLSEPITFRGGYPPTPSTTAADQPGTGAEALATSNASVAVKVLRRAHAARDGYTAGHQDNVADLSVAIGQFLHMPPRRLEGLRLGASIHDIGKLRVPMAILNKRGALSDDERAIVQTHSEVGRSILAGVNFPWPLAEMVLQHHERMDGSGYPNRLKGDAILLEARIIAVADVVEAMTLARPYRRALGLNAALEELRHGRGRLYDPAVVDACLRVFADTPFTFAATDAARRPRPVRLHAPGAQPARRTAARSIGPASCSGH